MSTTSIHPSDALINLSFFLARGTAITDENFNPLLQSILRLEEPNYLDLDRVAEIQRKISLLTPEQKAQLTGKLDQIVARFFKGGNEASALKDWELIKNIEDTRHRGNVLETLLMIPKNERGEMIQDVVSIFNGLDFKQIKSVFTTLDLIRMETSIHIGKLIQEAMGHYLYERDRSSCLDTLADQQIYA